MTRQPSTRGFTIVELAVVIAIIGAIAVMAIAYSRWIVRNASVDSAGAELVVRLAGLPATALTNGEDRVLVVVDRDATGATPMRTFLLRNPSPAWSLSAFDPSKPGTNAEEVVEDEMPRRAHLVAVPSSPSPAPLQAAKILDSQMLSSCGGATCFAVRVTADGEMLGEDPGGGTSPAPGFGFILGDIEDTGSASAAKRRGVVLGFPTGVVKTYTP